MVYYLTMSLPRQLSECRSFSWKCQCQCKGQRSAGKKRLKCNWCWMVGRSVGWLISTATSSVLYLFYSLFLRTSTCRLDRHLIFFCYPAQSVGQVAWIDYCRYRGIYRCSKKTTNLLLKWKQSTNTCTCSTRMSNDNASLVQGNVGLVCFSVLNFDLDSKITVKSFHISLPKSSCTWNTKMHFVLF